ncbi:MAG: 1,4-dihydroxy-2-naphthoate octaprenyltransferase [Chloroflexi bacterium]|nr:1,4-dihydroxy-2-naphthoate octaprenyltransferase [Chloroflexota bacterium]
MTTANGSAPPPEPASNGPAAPTTGGPVFNASGVAVGAPRPSLPVIWYRAIRPFSFTASIIPVLVGGACALVVGGFSPVAFLLCLGGGMALQAGVNLTNDYFDHQLGADHSGSLGPSRVIQEGWLSPGAVLAGGVTFFVLGGLAGFALAGMAGWPILLLGLVGVPLAYGYTAPPLKLAYRGLGELNVFVLMGPMMVVGGFLVHRVAGWGVALTASLPVGCLVASILHANNLRDLDDDRALGKKTLATIVGPWWGKAEMLALLWGAYAALIASVWLRVLPRAALLALLSAPAALTVSKTVVRGQTPLELAPSVRQAAKLHTQFGLLLALGLVVGAGWRWLKRRG